ncbi:response regulator transcription factor [Fulvivirga sp. 29W222]|uniref:Response regulator transcription factor n=1 Tax=Fulvivirga marina TaxID=2494733 RepID=A0A937KCE0_9BACT|nr:response regulator transcription factor [Fulvivirga marina]MBL6447274.1 response regulator transcription factor [Fulvivirga marina]
MVSLVEEQPGFRLLDQDSDNSTPDVTILDLATYLNDSNKLIGKGLPKSSILILARDYSKQDIDHIIKSGIKGCISYECERDEVVSAIQNLAKGQRFFCSSILNVILEQPSPALEPLSPREVEVMHLIIDGNSSSCIAEKLNLSIHTINSHRKNILQKLNLKSPTQLIIYAIENGIISSK